MGCATTEDGLHGGVGGAVSGNDDVIGEPEGEAGEGGGDSRVGKVSSLCTYIPQIIHPKFSLTTFEKLNNIWQDLREFSFLRR